MAETVKFGESVKPISSTTENSSKCNEGENNNTNGGFQSYTTQLQVGEGKILVRLLKMKGSNILFLNQLKTEHINEFATAMPPMNLRNKDVSASTTLIGAEFGCKSQRLAEQFTKRYGCPFFVGCNIDLEGINGPLVERSVSEWLRQMLEKNVKTM